MSSFYICLYVMSLKPTLMSSFHICEGVMWRQIAGSIMLQSLQYAFYSIDKRRGLCVCASSSVCDYHTKTSTYKAQRRKQVSLNSHNPHQVSIKNLIKRTSLYTSKSPYILNNCIFQCCNLLGNIRETEGYYFIGCKTKDEFRAQDWPSMTGVKGKCAQGCDMKQFPRSIEKEGKELLLPP